MVKIDSTVVWEMPFSIIDFSTKITYKLKLIMKPSLFPVVNSSLFRGTFRTISN